MLRVLFGTGRNAGRHVDTFLSYLDPETKITEVDFQPFFCIFVYTYIRI